MAALQPVAQTARVVVAQKWLQSPVVNVFHWYKAAPVSPFTQAEIQALADGVRQAFSQHFGPLQDGDLTVTGCVATDLSSETGVTGAVTTAVPGTKVGVSNPASIALCISWIIARHYRGGHPRSYMGGTVTGDILGVHQFQSAVVASWDSAAEGFKTQVNALQPGSTASGNLVAVHRKRNKIDLIPPLISPITSARVDVRIDSQRRRLGKAPIA